jgi:hypothetical protein
VVPLSEKYAAWRAYDERPDGSGIYRLICQLNRPIRLTHAELEAHSAWRGLGAAAERHPPMRGWLAVPLTGRGGRNIGLLQLSDRYDGEFTVADEAVLVELARRASVALQDLRESARAQRRRGGTREKLSERSSSSASNLAVQRPPDAWNHAAWRLANRLLMSPGLHPPRTAASGAPDRRRSTGCLRSAGSSRDAFASRLRWDPLRPAPGPAP